MKYFKFHRKSVGILAVLLTALPLLVCISGLQSAPAQAASGLEVYTQVSQVSAPAWERTVTLTDLSDQVKFKINIKNLTAATVDNLTVKFEPAAGLEFADPTVTVIKNAGETTHSASDLVSASGLNIGSLTPWTPTVDYAEVIFKVKLAYCPWTNLYRSGIRADSDQTDEAVDQIDLTINAHCQGLSLEKLVSNTNNPEWKTQVSANHGDYVQYKIKLHNPNPLPMTEPRIKDVLPAGLTLREDTVRLIFLGNTMSPNPANGNIFGDGYLLVTTLDPYNSGNRPYWEVTYKARVGDCPVSGTKVNSARAWTKWEDVVTASATVIVAACPTPTPTPTPTPGACQLSLNKKIVWQGNEYDQIDKETHLYDPGEKVSYKFYVKNNGGREATNVKVKDVLPAYLRDLDGRDEKEFNIGTLAAGGEWSGSYEARVLADLPQNDRTQENRATVSASEGCTDEDSAFIWINGPEILAAEVQAAAVAAAPAELPATGPAVPAAIGLSGLLSLGFYLRRRGCIGPIGHI